MQELQNQPVLVLLLKEISGILPLQQTTEIYMIKQELIRLWVLWTETVDLIDTCRIKYKINEIIKASWESGLNLKHLQANQLLGVILDITLVELRV